MSYVAPAEWRPAGGVYLEDNAWEALQKSGQSTSIIASAGAGKTEFLAQKAAYLLQTNLCEAPKRILAISFKRDAARNLSDRVHKRCAPELARRFDSITFDAFTKSIIDRLRPALPAPYGGAANYEISFPKRDAIEDFLRRHNAHGESQATLNEKMAVAPLPIATAPINERWRQLLQAYWTEAYASNPAQLTFLMLNRLADYLFRTDVGITRALRLTYPYVFLDEFQDTTEAQYDLLRSMFLGSVAKLTAVGDDKQRIMGWAGAMPDGFERFKTDFDAEEIVLHSNWRSHADLVQIQHVIAQRIDPQSQLPQARAKRGVVGDVAAIWDYRTRQEEAQGVTDWIKEEVETGGFAPDDFAILVRQSADDIEKELAPEFAAKGLRLRNVARSAGGVPIQDTLAEEITAAVIPLMRLAAEERAPASWQSAIRLRQDVLGLDDGDDDGLYRARQELDEFVAALRTSLQSAPRGAQSAEAAAEDALQFIGERTLRRGVPSYRRDADYERTKAGFLALLRECTSGAANWKEVLDRFEGIGQVSLMTIHRSKGLEFHTMIFMGLDNKSWWSLDPRRSEELKSFFVAFTRAKQRAFFTSCQQRGGTINWIDALLSPAGVARVEGPG